MKSQLPLSNRHLAELFIRESAQTVGSRSEHLLRLARKAYLWHQEAYEVVARGDSLLELDGIKTKDARTIQAWMESPPAVPKHSSTCQEFLTMAEARAVLARNPEWRRRAKGDLQMHTTWSDGAESVIQMTAKAIERGYQYIAITDHTVGLKVANGMHETRLKKQATEIKAVNSTLADQGIKFEILHAVEMNLSPTGEGDMKPSVLKKLDLVLGAFHSSLQTEGDQTARYLAALRNPSINVLAHPQTRRFNQRVGLKADWHRVFTEAARQNKALEIDGYAERQDLRLSLLTIAKKEGCLISMGSDAHHGWQLEFLDFALAAAFLAKIPRDRILNFWDVEKLKRWAVR